MICEVCKSVKKDYEIPYKKINLNNKEITLCSDCSNINALETYFEENFNTDIDLILASEVLKHLKDELKKFKNK